jgi:hypothetical protein
MNKLLNAAAVAMVAVALGVATPAGAGGRPLSARLSSANEVPAPTGSSATGTVRMTLNQGQGEVCVEIASRGLTGSVVAGHIHAGSAGVNGPVVVNLGVNSAGFNRCIDGVGRDLIKAIRQHPGNYYVNIHTSTFPSGEIRGQLSK